MHKSTSPQRKSFILYAAATTALLALGSVSALVVGVTPAMAANLATKPDTQVAVFMVPLTILVLAVLFEVTRVALRGALPVEAPRRPPAPRPWSPGRAES